MPPAFDPGPAPFGRPRVLLGGVGPHLTRVASEIGDGIPVHPFATRESLEQITLPALDEGLRTAGRIRSDLETAVLTMIATGETGAELDEAIATVRGQFALYGSTPAYARVLECNGRGGLHPRLNALSKEGWEDDLVELVTDEMVESIAIVGRCHEIAGRIRAKEGGIADTVSLECPRRPDPGHFVAICRALQAGG
jgi:probable F420-dependent oxidoreductase